MLWLEISAEIGLDFRGQFGQIPTDIEAIGKTTPHEPRLVSWHVDGISGRLWALALKQHYSAQTFDRK